MMASDLREALEEIASESRPNDPAGDLWRRGRARHRVRTAGAALAATLLLGAGGGLVLGLDATRSAEPPVADVPASELHLPDRVYDASGWTKGARVVGPIAVAWSASRTSWTGSDQGIMTVSAVDGRYRFIEAPGLDRLEGLAGEWALSPGGRYVAWWDRSTSDQVYDAVASLNVYDAETGRVLVHEQPELNGNLPARGQLAWLDQDTLVFDVASVAVHRSDTSSGFTTKAEGAQVWDVHDDAIRQTDLTRWTVQPPRLLEQRSKRLWNVDRVSSERTPFARLPEGLLSPSISPSGTTFAGLGTTGGRARELVWGDVAPAGRGATHHTGVEITHVVAWRNNQTLVALVDGDTRSPAYDLVDLEGGQVSPLVTVPYFDGDNLQIATALVSAPTTPGIRPGRTWDPRVPILGGALVLSAAAVWVLRRWWVSRWS